MTNRHSEDKSMRLAWIAIIALLMYTTILVLALNFRPPDTFETDDWREAAKYERQCNGTATSAQVYDEYGMHYELTCEVK
jgi:hypothetical protein